MKPKYRLERMTMHEYRCPKCGLHWWQEHYFALELCTQCDEMVPRLSIGELEVPVRINEQTDCA